MKKTTAILGATALSLIAGTAWAETSACLITKTDTNPFFVKMKEGAEAKAAELGIELKSYAGRIDGDNESQVAAIEACIADGAKGILIRLIGGEGYWAYGLAQVQDLCRRKRIALAVRVPSAVVKVTLV